MRATSGADSVGRSAIAAVALLLAALAIACVNGRSVLVEPAEAEQRNDSQWKILSEPAAGATGRDTDRP